MVTLYDKELNDKPKYPKNPITKTTFLNSLFDYPSGIDCICTSISPIFENPMNDNKPSIIANIRILDYMPNCKAFEIGEDGQYVELLDELNRPQKVLTRSDGYSGALKGIRPVTRPDATSQNTSSSRMVSWIQPSEDTAPILRSPPNCSP